MTTSSDGATSELLTAIGRDVGALLREELARIRVELAGTAREGRRAAMLLGGAGVLGSLAAGVSAAAFVRILERFLPAPVAAVVATMAYGAGAVGLARLAVAELRRAREALPAGGREAGLP